MEDNKRRKGTGIVLAVVIVCCALFLGLVSAIVAFFAYGGSSYIMSEKTKQEQKRVYEQLESTQTMTRIEDGGIEDLSGIVEEVMPSIVAITSTTTTTYYNFFGSFDQDTEGSGSGIIFEDTGEELLIMTNNHVINGAKSIQITFGDGSLADGQVKGADSNSDLAVVAVKAADLSEETKAAIRVARLGDTKECKVGQMVMAIGNALGYGQSLTVGYVSAKDREVYVDDRTMTLLQTDAAINPGNSGGALINMQGEVIGINSVKYSAEAVEGMGYAIPMDTALPIIEDLKNRVAVSAEDQGYLGVYYEAVSDEMNQIYQVPYGLYISKVVKDSAAEKAGLYAGDVITAINGYEVPTQAALQEQMQLYRIGDQITVTIQRYYRGGYREVEVEVTLGSRPQE